MLQKYRVRLGLSYEQREEYATNDNSAMDIDSLDLNPIPPGEEGILTSHAGGEEQLCRELFTNRRCISPVSALLPESPRHVLSRHDGRSRRDRTHLKNEAWAPQIPDLANAYLGWKRRAATNESLSTLPRPTAGHGPSCSLTSSVSDIIVALRPLTSTEAFARLLDGQRHPILPHRSGQRHSRDAWLPRYWTSIPRSSVLFPHPRGLSHFPWGLPSTERTSLLSRSRRSSHGTYRIADASNHSNPTRQEPYQRLLAEQFSAVFDVYNDILHQVDKLVASALHREGADYRMCNACAPCLYRLEGETYNPTLLACMDGNSSLKLVDDSFRSGEKRRDERTWRTDLFMTPEEVDRFKDEVRDAQKVSICLVPFYIVSHSLEESGLYRVSALVVHANWLCNCRNRGVDDCHLPARWRSSPKGERSRRGCLGARSRVRLGGARSSWQSRDRRRRDRRRKRRARGYRRRRATCRGARRLEVRLC